MPHRTHLRVRFYELDPYNHVNHASYIQYFEVARVEMLDGIGMSMGSLAERDVRIVVVGLTIRFHASAGEGDELTVETEVLDVKGAVMRWRQRLLRGDRLLADQEIRAATTTVEGRPIRVPAYLATALERYRTDPPASV